MGKYSLDAFERYPLTKLRPKTPPPDTQYTPIASLVCPALPDRFAPGTLLRLTWSETQPDLAYLRSLSRLCPPERAAGIILDGAAVENPAALCRDLLSCFPGIPFFAPPGSSLRPDVPCGLFLDLSQGILPLRLAVARHHLEESWREIPVCVSAAEPLTSEVQEALTRWHCSFCSAPAIVGPRLTLRRLMFPRDLTANAPAPFRMWWQNLGPAPLYTPALPRLALEYQGRPVPLGGGEPMAVSLGDAVCNPMLTLPDLPDGEYPLLCALEVNGQKQRLCMDAARADGFYTVGTIHLDHTPRPYLQTMWLDQYADGYYPLEDPAAPEEQGEEGG